MTPVNHKSFETRLKENQERLDCGIVTTKEFEKVQSNILKEKIVLLKAKNRKIEQTLFN